MVQVNVNNGYITLGRVNADEYTLKTNEVGDFDAVKLDYDDMAELRAALWDAMRRQGRGFEISIDDVLKIEEVRHKGRYSVEGYEEEITWTIDLLRKHLRRIEGWKETPAADRGAYGKLDEFLLQLEEPPRHTEDEEDTTPVAQCQICGCTLDISGLEQSRKYVCEDCRARNPRRLPNLPTAALA